MRMNPAQVLRTLRMLLRQRTGLDPVHGVSLSSDLGRLVPSFRARVIFDVGANRGQSAMEFSTCFPDAFIHCFEPIRSTFLQLRRNTSSMRSVECHNLALGSAKRAALMASAKKSELSFLVESDERGVSSGSAVETVEVDTIDGFCAVRSLKHIDLLKVDTEGHDMEVLVGAAALIEAQCIDVIQVEAGMSSQNTRHVAFERFRDFFEPRSYVLFGLYEQVHEWTERKPNLRRSNAVFISSRLVDVTTTP